MSFKNKSERQFMAPKAFQAW